MAGDACALTHHFAVRHGARAIAVLAPVGEAGESGASSHLTTSVSCYYESSGGVRHSQVDIHPFGVDERMIFPLVLSDEGAENPYVPTVFGG